jgi:hypothetical protein
VVNVRNFTAPGNLVRLLPGDSIRVFKGQPLQGRQIDNGNAVRLALKAVRDAVYQALIQARTGGANPVPGSGNGTQADKGKPGTSTTPGTPPAPPGTPPPPPGGGQ